jgi:hypothetical protein
MAELDPLLNAAWPAHGAPHQEPALQHARQLQRKLLRLEPVAVLEPHIDGKTAKARERKRLRFALGGPASPRGAGAFLLRQCCGLPEWLPAATENNLAEWRRFQPLGRRAGLQIPGPSRPAGERAATSPPPQPLRLQKRAPRTAQETATASDNFPLSRKARAYATLAPSANPQDASPFSRRASLRPRAKGEAGGNPGPSDGAGLLRRCAPRNDESSGL